LISLRAYSAIAVTFSNEDSPRSARFRREMSRLDISR